MNRLGEQLARAWRLWPALAGLGVGGCGGEFSFTAPDVAGLPGKTVAVVVRLQRSEVWKYAPPTKTAAITFRLGDGPMRSAKTDSAGFAAVAMELPAKPGRYQIALYHQDLKGDTASGTVAAYVLAADRPIAAVDADSLPVRPPAAGEAAAAITRVAAEAQVIYTTEENAGTPARARDLLAKAGYPDGPVLPYARLRTWRHWRYWQAMGRQADVHPLVSLKDNLPELRWGIAADDSAAETFAQAGLKTIGVVDGSAKAHSSVFFSRWSELQLPPPDK